MPAMDPFSTPSLFSSMREWYRRERSRRGTLRAIRDLLKILLQFLRDSTPESRRRRYGDVDYDWECHVDTTSATVGWRERLLGAFHSPYQPTEPALFDEMMARLPADLSNFVFIDIGSGKGRALLMAAKYPFRRIIGIELMPGLHRIAVANVEKLRAVSDLSGNIELFQMDATEYAFPPEPSVLYLFNPLPEESLAKLLARLSHSLDAHPREVYLVYHNPILAHVVESTRRFARIDGTPQYVLYRTEPTG
jgi:SAM-dependent methyltransferase